MTHTKKLRMYYQFVASLIIVIVLVVGIGNFKPIRASVDSVTGADNLLLNSQFKALDYGTAPIASATGVGNFFNTRWRGKHVYGSSSATFQQIDRFSGGTKLTLSNSDPDYFYLRQTVPGVMQFSNKTFTVRADVASADAGLQYDFYVNARWSNSQWVGVTDTNQFSLTSGIHTTTFTVGDLSAYSGYTEDFNGGLEVAFRVYSPNTQTNAEVDIDSISLYEGSNLHAAPISDYAQERPILNSFYETSGYTTGVVGLDTAGGQKRATFYMTTHKRRGTNFDLTFYDALGNEGKVSTYSQSGARVDNITPDSVRHSSNSIIFVFYDSNIAGIGLRWIADSET